MPKQLYRSMLGQRLPGGLLQVGEGPFMGEADFELNRTTDAAERQPLGPTADTSRNPGWKNVTG